VFGNMPQRAGLLSLSGTMATSPQGGQYVLPNQGGLTAPTGALASLANNAPGISALGNVAGGIPSIIPGIWTYAPVVNWSGVTGFGGPGTRPPFNEDFTPSQQTTSSNGITTTVVGPSRIA